MVYFNDIFYLAQLSQNIIFINKVFMRYLTLFFMLSLESQCGFYASSTISIWTKDISGAQCHTWQWLLDSAALSFTTALKEEPQPSPLCQLGCWLPSYENSTKPHAALRPRRANLAKALVTGSVHSLGGLCSGFSQVPPPALRPCAVSACPEPWCAVRGTLPSPSRLVWASCPRCWLRVRRAPQGCCLPRPPLRLRARPRRSPLAARLVQVLPF